jgi:predicted ATP-grasp superfamily ATP-dependent carboligase
MSGPVKFLGQPELDRPIVIVSWLMDIVGIGEKTTSYLNRKLDNKVFCEIEPDEYFPLEGVSLDDDVIQFPDIKFYAGQRKDVVILRAASPRFEWYRFFETVLGIANDYCHAREIYAIGSMVSIIPHTTPREMMANFSSADLKESVGSYNLTTTWNYETPPGQRPTLNSYLLWAAQRKNIPAATLWVPVPFYIATSGDPRGELRVLEFFNRKLNLCLNMEDLDDEVRLQNRALNEIRAESTEVDSHIRKIESGETLAAEESQQLVALVEKSLARKR